MTVINIFTDPVPLTQKLIQCRSINPVDDGALNILETALMTLGFTTWRIPFVTLGFPVIDNLYARLGVEGRNFCFAGHTDVVSPGINWTIDPFSGAVFDNYLFGRGAVDMKGAIACFIAAVARFLIQRSRFTDSISLLLTGDEEGLGIDGTARVLTWLHENDEVLDACLVGEPTNPTKLGEMVKIGRRGSLNAVVRVFGMQGHTAYAHLADNPIDHLLNILRYLSSSILDNGSIYFQPSSIVLTSIDVGNLSTNVIPYEARAAINVRFNDLHTGASVEQWIRSHCDASGSIYSLVCQISGEPFLTIPNALTQDLERAIYSVTGYIPVLSTSGGTSDARFIKSACPVVEFGLVGKTMHKVDESTQLAELEALTTIYQRVLENYFT